MTTAVIVYQIKYKLTIAKRTVLTLTQQISVYCIFVSARYSPVWPTTRHNKMILMQDI